MVGHLDEEQREPFLDEKVDNYRVDKGLDHHDEKRRDDQQPFPLPQVVPAAPLVTYEDHDIARRAQDVLEILHRARETTESSARERLALELKALHVNALRRDEPRAAVTHAVAQRLRSLPLEKGRALGIEYNSLGAVVRDKDAVAKRETKTILLALTGYAIATLVFWVFRDFISEHAMWGPCAVMAGVLVISLCTALMILFTNDKTPVLNSNLSTRFYDLRATGLTFVAVYFVLAQTISVVSTFRDLWTAGAWYSYAITPIMPFVLVAWPMSGFWVVATQPAVRINLWRQPAEGKLCRPWAAEQKETAQRKKNRESFRRNWRILLVPIGGASLFMFVAFFLCGGLWLAVGMAVFTFVVGLIMVALGVGPADKDYIDAATTDEEAVDGPQSPVALGAGPSDSTFAPVL